MDNGSLKLAASSSNVTARRARGVAALRSTAFLEQLSERRQRSGPAAVSSGLMVSEGERILHTKFLSSPAGSTVSMGMGEDFTRLSGMIANPASDVVQVLTAATHAYQLIVSQNSPPPPAIVRSGLPAALFAAVERFAPQLPAGDAVTPGMPGKPVPAEDSFTYAFHGLVAVTAVSLSHLVYTPIDVLNQLLNLGMGEFLHNFVAPSSYYFMFDAFCFIVGNVFAVAKEAVPLFMNTYMVHRHIINFLTPQVLASPELVETAKNGIWALTCAVREVRTSNASAGMNNDSDGKGYSEFVPETSFMGVPVEEFNAMSDLFMGIALGRLPLPEGVSPEGVPDTASAATKRATSTLRQAWWGVSYLAVLTPATAVHILSDNDLIPRACDLIFRGARICAWAACRVIGGASFHRIPQFTNRLVELGAHRALVSILEQGSAMGAGMPGSRDNTIVRFMHESTWALSNMLSISMAVSAITTPELVSILLAHCGPQVPLTVRSEVGWCFVNIIYYASDALIVSLVEQLGLLQRMPELLSMDSYTSVTKLVLDAHNSVFDVCERVYGMGANFDRWVSQFVSSGAQSTLQTIVSHGTYDGGSSGTQGMVEGAAKLLQRLGLESEIGGNFDDLGTDTGLYGDFETMDYGQYE